jgi:hypothetical protein
MFETQSAQTKMSQRHGMRNFPWSLHLQRSCRSADRLHSDLQHWSATTRRTARPSRELQQVIHSSRTCFRGIRILRPALSQGSGFWRASTRPGGLRAKVCFQDCRAHDRVRFRLLLKHSIIAGDTEAWAVYWQGGSRQGHARPEEDESERESDDSDSDEQPPPRIVTRVPTPADTLFVLHCTCEHPTQHLFPCRHILSVNAHTGHSLVPREQVHFRWTIVYSQGKLTVNRFVFCSASTPIVLCTSHLPVFMLTNILSLQDSRRQHMWRPLRGSNKRWSPAPCTHAQV